MARLTSAQRAKLPSSVFAGPNRSFPIPDKAHAVAAKRLVGRALHAGSINSSQAASIKAKANKKLDLKASMNKLMGKHMDAEDMIDGGADEASEKY